LPLLIEHEQANMKTKQQRVRLILKTVDAYFYVQVTAWACLMLANTNYKNILSMEKVLSFDAANKLLPAIVLIISIVFFRYRFSGKRNQKIFARENIIVVHIAIFLFYVTTYAANNILNSHYVSSPNGSMQECRLLISYLYFGLFYIASNIATIILFIHMSVVFSRPLNGYWKEFLLSYRKNSLS
jgi:uncharacterized protein (DUF486 family)